MQFLSAFTIFTDGFNLYCLHEAAPGSNHTGYYIFSFDFVYVGNYHGEGGGLKLLNRKPNYVLNQPNFNKSVTFTATVRNLLVMSSVFSVLTGVILLITSVMLLDALRKEQETAFKGKFELYNRTALYCTSCRST